MGQNTSDNTNNENPGQRPPLLPARFRRLLLPAAIATIAIAAVLNFVLIRHEPYRATSASQQTGLEATLEPNLFARAQQVYGSYHYRFNVPPPPTAWVVPPPPAENTPEAWLVRAENADAEVSRDRNALSYYPYLYSDYREQSVDLERIDSDTTRRLIAFGKPSIKACVDQLLAGRRATIHSTVLAALGTPSIEPIMHAAHLRSELTGVAINVIQNMKDNPGSELLRLACKPGGTRASTVEVLAYFADRHSLQSDERYALARPGAISDGSRLALLMQLHGESDAKVRRDLLVVQKFFKSPNAQAVAELSNVLKHDPDETVRAAAADMLRLQLEVSPAGSCASMIAVFCTAIENDKSDMVKAPCALALGQVRSKLTNSVISALRKARLSHDEDLAQEALKSLAHQAIYNKQCIPEVVSALDSGYPGTVEQAIDNCIAIGGPAAPATGRLEEIAGHNVLGLGAKALEALKAIRPNTLSSAEEK